MSRSPSPSEHGGSPYSGPLPGSGRRTRHIRGLHEIVDLNGHDWILIFIFKTAFHFVHHVGFIPFYLFDNHMSFSQRASEVSEVNPHCGLDLSEQNPQDSPMSCVLCDFFYCQSATVSKMALSGLPCINKC